MITTKTYLYNDVTNEMWDECERFCRKHQALPFKTVGWLRATVQGLQDKTKLRIVCGWREGVLVGFLPFEIEHAKFAYCINYTVCTSWSNWMPLWMVYSTDLTHDELKDLTSRMHDTLPSWDVLFSGRMCGEGELALRSYLSSRELTYNTNEHQIASISGEDFETFLAQIDRKWRRQYLKQVRRIEQTGSPEILHLFPGDSEELQAILDRVMRIYRQSQKIGIADRDNNLLQLETYNRFAALLTYYCSVNGLHVMFAVVDGEDAAYYIGVHRYKMYCSLETGFSEKFRKLRPGALLRMENIRYTIQNGYIENNLMANQNYQSEITNSITSHFRFQVFAGTFPGAMLKIQNRAQKWLDYYWKRIRDYAHTRLLYFTQLEK